MSAGRFYRSRHAAVQCAGGSFMRFFGDHIFMDTTTLVSIFVVLLEGTALCSGRIIRLAALLAALVPVSPQTQPSPLPVAC